jgi:hypothetical protein
MPWSKRLDDPLVTQMHGAFAASVLQKPTTDRENEEALRENHLITNRLDVRQGFAALVRRDACVDGNGSPLDKPDHEAFLNGNAMAAEALGADQWACNRLDKADINIAMIRARILFWEIAENMSEEDIEHGFLNLLDVNHLSVDHAFLNSYKGWMVNRIKEHVDTHEVVMSRREAPKRMPGLGGSE